MGILTLRDIIVNYNQHYDLCYAVITAHNQLLLKNVYISQTFNKIPT